MMHARGHRRKQNYTIPNVLPLIRVTLLARERVGASERASERRPPRFYINGVQNVLTPRAQTADF